MKAAPTLEGGLRIDIERKSDWAILSLICIDARGPEGHCLAQQLGQQSSTHPLSENEDWKDYVIPDLHDTFSKQILDVAAQISAANQQLEEAGSILIKREQVDTWFGALNQARLHLEDQYQLSSQPEEELDSLARSAKYRYEFYTLVQSWLLSVMP